MDLTKVIVGIVGINEWSKYTLPCVKSIHKYEPGVKIILLDNGSNPRYPLLKHNALTLRINKTVSYAAAMNTIVRMEQNFDWFMLVNNDVTYSKPFCHIIEMMHPNGLYGFYLHEINKREYISSWAWFFHRDLWFDVGEFDENFAPLGYEDADYSFRAVDKGYSLISIDRKCFGIRHVGYNQKLPTENLNYLKETHDL